MKDYVARIRVNIARRLLTETRETLDTIAARVGFADASSFSRMFKSVDGIAPGEFRRTPHIDVFFSVAYRTYEVALSLAIGGAL